MLLAVMICQPFFLMSPLKAESPKGGAGYGTSVGSLTFLFYIPSFCPFLRSFKKILPSTFIYEPILLKRMRKL